MRGIVMRLQPCFLSTWFMLASFYVSSVHAQETLKFPDTQQLLGHETPGEFATLKAKAEQGDPVAQTALGDRYLSASSIAQDFTQAEKWYTAAAAQNFAEAQFVLGYLYQHGVGVRKNDRVAFRYYSGAAEQGHAIAQNNLAF